MFTRPGLQFSCGAFVYAIDDEQFFNINIGNFFEIGKTL